MNYLTIRANLLLLFGLFFYSVTYSQTIVNGSFVYDGIERTYRVYIPSVYSPSTAVPLLFNLHGFGSNNIEQEIYGNFRPIADTAGFIIVHPNGTFDAQNNRFWNTFGTSTVDDVGFLSALIDTISADYTIDQNRIYSTGMSNGGFMSYELACQLSERIAAIASVTGSMVYDHFNACNAIHPTPVMEIHGTADGTVPFNGNAFFVPIDELVAYWAEFNNCSTVPVITQVPDIDPTDGCTAELQVFNNGDLGSRVELFKVIGGGHTWPGATFVIGVTNMDFSASTEIWHFFSQYDLNGLITTGIADDTYINSEFKVYPNPGQRNFSIDFFDYCEKQITITNLYGQIIADYLCYDNNSVFIIEKSGVYLVKVKTGNEIKTKKVINY
jgi:polyhydroxybutyrate depolymerase